jgi:hypothetical protein
MIRVYKISLNFLCASAILLAIVFVECAKPGKNYNSIVDTNLKHLGHGLFLRCSDPFTDNSIIGITVDSLVKRIGKANAYGVVKDTLYLDYRFEIIPLDSYTIACKGKKTQYDLIRISNIRYRFIKNRLESHHCTIYK